MSGPELNVQLGEVGKRIMEQRKRMGLTQKELLFSILIHVPVGFKENIRVMLTKVNNMIYSIRPIK